MTVYGYTTTLDCGAYDGDIQRHVSETEWLDRQCSRLHQHQQHEILRNEMHLRTERILRNEMRLRTERQDRDESMPQAGYMLVQDLDNHVQG